MILVGEQYEQHLYFSLNDIYENALKTLFQFHNTHTPFTKVKLSKH